MQGDKAEVLLIEIRDLQRQTLEENRAYHALVRENHEKALVISQQRMAQQQEDVKKLSAIGNGGNWFFIVFEILLLLAVGFCLYLQFNPDAAFRLANPDSGFAEHFKE